MSILLWILLLVTVLEMPNVNTFEKWVRPMLPQIYFCWTAVVITEIWLLAKALGV